MIWVATHKTVKTHSAQRKTDTVIRIVVFSIFFRLWSKNLFSVVEIPLNWTKNDVHSDSCHRLLWNSDDIEYLWYFSERKTKSIRFERVADILLKYCLCPPSAKHLHSFYSHKIRLWPLLFGSLPNGFPSIVHTNASFAKSYRSSDYFDQCNALFTSNFSF